MISMTDPKELSEIPFNACPDFIPDFMPLMTLDPLFMRDSCPVLLMVLPMFDGAADEMLEP